MKRRMVIVAVVIALAAAACGGDGDGSGIASLESDDPAVLVAGSPEGGDAAEEVDFEESMLAFAECMREQGIDMDDPTFDGSGGFQMSRPGGGTTGEGGDIDRDAMMAARDVCSVHLEGVAQQFERADQTEMQDQLLEYASCMRENGYDMADPDLSEGTAGMARGLLGDIDREDPAFQEANEVCQDLFAGGMRPGGGMGAGQGAGAGPGGGN